MEQKVNADRPENKKSCTLKKSIPYKKVWTTVTCDVCKFLNARKSSFRPGLLSPEKIAQCRHRKSKISSEKNTEKKSSRKNQTKKYILKSATLFEQV